MIAISTVIKMLNSGPLIKKAWTVVKLLMDHICIRTRHKSLDHYMYNAQACVSGHMVVTETNPCRFMTKSIEKKYLSVQIKLFGPCYRNTEHVAVMLYMLYFTRNLLL